MRFRFVLLVAVCAAIACGSGVSIYAQSEATPIQQLDVMRSRLDTMRRTLNGAVAGLNATDQSAQKPATLDDPRTRLRGLEQETNSLLSEVNDVRSKQERAERYDPTILDKLKTAISDLDERVQAALRDTASARRSTAATATADTATGTTKKKKKKKGTLFGRLFGGGDDEKYDELVGTVAPGRDRVLFEEAANESRKNNYETARALFNVIITTYPESAYLPLAKLAIADTFYLEGTTSSLIQAGAAYQDWLAFFPTDPLADDVMLKIAEVEMRKMGLPDRDVTSARKAEQRLKVLLQQFPNTSLRPEAEIRLREVQENLAMHNLLVGNQYYDRFFQGKAPNPKGAQSRYREIVEKFPNFSYMDEVLYRLAVTYVQEEEPDEAAKYFQQLARNYPNSKHAEKAREQLDAIGAPAPEPDMKKMNEPTPARPSMTQRIMREVLGTTPVTVDKSGILISNKSKDASLIDEAIRNGGQLPITTPTVPVKRSAPARQLQTAPPTATPTNKSGGAQGITATPAQPGPPASGSTTTVPATTPQTAAPPPTDAPTPAKKP